MTPARLFVVLALGAAVGGCTASLPLRHALPEPGHAPARPGPDARPKVAVALGSGGLRGFAHIGVLKALEASGIEVDLVVGTSAGSVVGVLYAGGFRASELEQAALELDPLAFFDVSLLDGGKVKGLALQHFVNEQLDGRPIEPLQREFAAVATRARDGRMQIFNRGDPGLAVRASSATRWRFLPARIGGADYVDGVEVSPVPIRAARQLGAGVVIAVNVNVREEHLRASGRWRSYQQYRQGLVDAEAPQADVLIHPDTGASSGMSEAYRREAIDRGEAAALERIPQIRAAIASRERLAASAAGSAASVQRAPSARAARPTFFGLTQKIAP